MKILNEAPEESIPKTKMSYYIHPNESDHLRLLEQLYTQLMNYNNWIIQELTLIRQIQMAIKEESIRLSNEKWNEKINKLNDSYKDPAKFWKEVKILMGSDTVKIPSLIDRNGEKVHGTKEKEENSEISAQTYLKISDDENQEFDILHAQRIIDYIQTYEYQIVTYKQADTDHLDDDNYLTRHVTNKDIIQIIKEFENNKVPGKSKINKIMLLQMSVTATDTFRKILNAAVSLGYFPIIIKNGIIILIPKPGKDRKDLANYRPIALLEIPGKILEIIIKRLHSFCEAGNVFHPYQYGFRAGKGTDIALNKLYETVSINQKYKEHCNVVCQDISKALDKVWSAGLKYKIITISSLSSMIKKILCSYVTDRSAQIRVENVLGPKLELEIGVPQGGFCHRPFSYCESTSG